MFERFTDRARRVLVLAQEEARLLNHSCIGTEHILLGLIHEGDGLAAKVLESLEISLEAVRGGVRQAVGPVESAPRGSPPFTPRAKKVLELSLREALQLGHNYIGTEHILLGLVREGQGVATDVLRNLGADVQRVRQEVIHMLAGSRDREPLGSGRYQGGGLPWVPTKVVAGPADRLASDGLEFSIVGVLLFDENVQVSWGLSGIPKPIVDLMADSSLFSANLQRGDSVAYLTLSDDVGTAYLQVAGNLVNRSDDSCIASSLFTPARPDGATRLRVTWGDQSIEVGL